MFEDNKSALTFVKLKEGKVGIPAGTLLYCLDSPTKVVWRLLGTNVTDKNNISLSDEHKEALTKHYTLVHINLY